MDEQAHLNADVWEHGDFVAQYATRELRPVEGVADVVRLDARAVP